MYIKASEGLNKVLSARQQRRLSLITGVKQSVMQSMDIVSRKQSPVFLVLLVVGFALFVLERSRATTVRSQSHRQPSCKA